MNRTITFSAIFGIAVLLTVAVSIPTDIGQTADAAISKGNSLTEIGSSKVCGDRLCSEIPPEERKTTTNTTPAKSPTVSADIDALMDRMNSVHEKHQSEMMQMWKSMTSQEQSKMF